VAVQDSVTLPAWQLSGDEVMNTLDRVVHGGTSHRAGSDCEDGPCGALAAAIPTSPAWTWPD